MPVFMSLLRSFQGFCAISHNDPSLNVSTGQGGDFTGTLGKKTSVLEGMLWKSCEAPESYCWLIFFAG